MMTTWVVTVSARIDGVWSREESKLCRAGAAYVALNYGTQAGLAKLGVRRESARITSISSRVERSVIEPPIIVRAVGDPNIPGTPGAEDLP